MTEAVQDIAVRDDAPLGVPLIQALAEAGELRRSAFVIVDPTITVEQYELFLRVMGEFKRTCSFAIGDLINFGEAAFPDEEYHERYERAVALTGLKFETLRNYASVCGRVAVGRRRDNLSFGHHETVASLDPHLQTEWLVAAEENGWGRAELRDRMREAKVLKPQSQLQWAGGRIGVLAPDLEAPPAPPAAPSGLASAPLPPQDAVVAPAPLPLAGPADPLLAAVRTLVESAELGRGDEREFYVVPRAALDEVAVLAALHEVEE